MKKMQIWNTSSCSFKYTVS